MKRLLNSVYLQLLDVIFLLFPRYCVGCNSILFKGISHYCFACRSHLQSNNAPKERLEDIESKLTKCLILGKISKVYSIYSYYLAHKEIRNSIHALKYHSQTQHLEILLSPSFNLLSKERFDYVVPMPLHPKREAYRGYNQAQKILDYLLPHLKIRDLSPIIKRSVNNPTQTKLDHIKRVRNVENIFSLTDEVLSNKIELSNASILIIDDVMTTGASISSIIKTIESLNIEGVKYYIFSIAIA